MDAYVLVQNSGHSELLAAHLEAIPEVVEAQDVSGAYDAIALVRSGSMRELVDAVLEEIRQLPGVTHAIPAPVMGSWRRGDGSAPSPADRAA